MEGSLRSHLWVVEEKFEPTGWIGWNDRARATRERARALARAVRKEDSDEQTRVRKYARVEGSR